MKKTNWFQTAVLLIMVIGLFLANLFTGDREFSPVENRNLAQKPDFSWDRLLSGKFMKDYEEYITDQFAGRDEWTALKAYAEKALGKKENNGVYICGDMLIEKFDAADEKQLAANLQSVERFRENAQIPVYLMLIPSAAEIHREKLPAGAPNIDQASVLASLSARTQMETVDVLSALRAHADEYIFYRTDHHWTSLGACYGADALLRAMGMEGVSVEMWEKQTVSGEFYGTLWSKSGARYISPDTIEIYVPGDGIDVLSFENGVWTEKPLYDMEKLNTKDQYSMFLGGNQPLAVIKTGRPGGKVLLLRDSYADCMVPFLMERFSEIHLIDLRYYRMNIAAYARENGMDAAVILYSLNNFSVDKNVSFLRIDAIK